MKVFPADVGFDAVDVGIKSSVQPPTCSITKGTSRGAYIEKKASSVKRQSDRATAELIKEPAYIPDEMSSWRLTGTPTR